MKTIEQAISEQLTTYGYKNFDLIQLDKMPAVLNASGQPFYEKQRLLIIFKRRLKGCLLHDPQNEMIEFLKSSVEKLESLPDDAEIYYWKADVNGKHFSGRSTSTTLLYSYCTDDAEKLYQSWSQKSADF